MSPDNQQQRTSWKRAEISDVETILGFMEHFYAEEGIRFEREKSKAALSMLLESSVLGEVFFVISEGRTAGYIALTNGFSLEFGGVFQFIDELFLVKEFRGRGLGGATLQFVEERAAQRGVVSLHLEVSVENLPAQRLYGKRGYASTGRYLWCKPIK